MLGTPRLPGARTPLTNRSGSNERTSIRHGYFKTFDGTRLFYSEEGDGLPLVFCYGLVCSSLHWTYQIDAFRNRYRTIWFDYRGHQSSDRPADVETMTVEMIARDLGQLFDELKLDQAVVLGHSMGVNVALDFARQFPERAKALILTNGTPNRPLDLLLGSNITEPAFDLFDKVQKRFPRVAREFWKLTGNNPLVHTLIAMQGFNPYLTPREDVVRYVQQVAQIEPDIFLKLIQNYQTYDATPWLHTLTQPTLIVSGERDRITPPSSQKILHELIPNSRLELVRHGSHCPQMDLPDLFNHLIANFLREISY